MKKKWSVIIILLVTSLFISCDNITGNTNENLSENSVVDISTILGVTVPIFGAAPAKKISETDQYTGTISWSGSPTAFIENTVYTATITLKAKTGITFDGVSANFFTVNGAATVTNSENSGIISATFPTTEEAPVEKPIFFTASSDDGLCRIAIDGSGMESIIPWAYHSDISPDGSKIVYHTNGGYWDDTAQQWVKTADEIFLADIDGSNSINLTNNNARDYDPCFSPDGRNILYVTDKYGDLDVMTIDLNGENETFIAATLNDECFPEYSPDGTQITYTLQEGNYSAIMISDTDGQNPVDLIQDSTQSVWTWGSHWHPDGAKLIFTAWNLNSMGLNQLYEVKADGSSIDLVCDSIDCRDASYSPDGSKIVFESKVNGYWQIFSGNADGTDLNQLVDLPNNCFHANWIW